MQVRLVITLKAAAGRGDEVAALLQARATEVVHETGCEQFELFRSLDNPDCFTLLERWSDQATLDAHAELNKTREPIDPALFAEMSQREDYSYNRTR